MRATICPFPSAGSVYRFEPPNRNKERVARNEASRAKSQEYGKHDPAKVLGRGHQWITGDDDWTARTF